VCTGDYDNDGFVDLFVTYWGQNVLYHNRGGHFFEDVTAQAGLVQDRTRYNTGCTFVDYDRDGNLDLFVANYLGFDFGSTPKPGQNPYCWYRGMPVACGRADCPLKQTCSIGTRQRNIRRRLETFGDLEPHQNYSLGVVTGDFNNDGWPDIYVACDRTASLLYVNQHNGQFTEEALFRGVALDEEGNALSGMGVAAGDYDADGCSTSSEPISRTNTSVFTTTEGAEFSTMRRFRPGLVAVPVLSVGDLAFLISTTMDWMTCFW